MVEAYDENTLTKDAFIGSFEVDLRSISKELDLDTKISQNIVDKKGRVTGTITLHGKLRKSMGNINKIQIPDKLNVFIIIEKIVLKNVNQSTFSSFFKSLSPHVTANFKSFNSATKPSTASGNDNHFIWDGLNWETEVFDATSLKTESLILNVMDGKKSMGISKFNNLAFGVTDERLGKSLDLDAEFVNDSNKKMGNLEISLTIYPESYKDKTINANIKHAEIDNKNREVAFEEGVVYIKRIRLSELKNMELIGKQDPFVSMDFNGWCEETTPLEDSGDFVLWDNLIWENEILSSDLLKGEMKFTVYEKNNILSDSLIGFTSIPMQRLAYSIDKEIEFKQEISVNGKKTGVIEVIFESRPIDMTKRTKLPDSFKEGLLCIEKIQAQNLRNLEFIGKQDPFIKISIDTYKDQTPILRNIGSNPLFDNLDIKTILPKKSIQNSLVIFEVMDEDNLKSKFLGKGQIKINKINELNKEFQFTVILKTEKNKSAGKLIVFMKLLEAPAPYASDDSKFDFSTIKLNDGNFKKGEITIKKVVIHKLKTKSIINNSPFAEISIENKWSEKLPAVSGGPGQIKWDLLDISHPITLSELKEDILSVVVKNDNILTKDSVIGSGTVRLWRLGNKIGIPDNILQVSIVDPKLKQLVGKVDVHLEVYPDEPDYSTLPITFTAGQFNINSLTCLSLKNTELIGKQDVYAKIKYANLIDEKTNVLENGGSNVIWDSLAIECEVNPQIVATQDLILEIYDKNSIRSDVLIGKGTVKISKFCHFIDKDSEIKVRIFDSKGKISGKVLLNGIIKAPLPEITIPQDYVDGELLIKEISIFNFQDTEGLGTSKTDPYVKLSFENIIYKTKVLDNVGGTASWKNLDYTFNLDKKDLSVGELKVEIWDDNDLASDHHMGDCLSQFRRFATKFDEDVEVIENVPYNKGKKTGKIKLVGCLKRKVAKKEIQLDLPKDFEVGVLTVYSISAYNLKNTELIGKQDPYVRLTLADNFETTNTLDNAGNDPYWDNTDIQFEVNRQILANEKLNIDFFDENSTRKDVKIGSASISIRKVCSRIGEKVKFETPLTTPNGESKSKAVIYLILKQGKLEDSMESIPENNVKAEQGVLRILNIEAKDLKGGDIEMLGNKADPFISLKLGDWTNRTNVLDDAGRNPHWTNLSDLETVVDNNMLKFQKLNFTILDKNSITKDSLMGSCELSLRKIGSIPFGKVDTAILHVKDKRGQRAGKLIVKYVLEELKNEDDEVDEKISISNGKIQVNKCIVYDLKGASTLKKQDIHIKIISGPWNTTLPAKKPSNGSLEWDCRIESQIFTGAAILKNKIEVEVLEKGLISGHKTIGYAKLSARGIFEKVNEFFEIKAQLISNPQNKSDYCGKIMLSARFTTNESLLETFSKSELPINNKPVVNEMVKELDEKAAKISNDLLKKVSKLEDGLDSERKKMFELMEKQNTELKKSIELLSKKLASQNNTQPIEVTPPIPAVEPIPLAKLPKDICKWKPVHVQAWLGYELELPQYIQLFSEASIDGLVLLKHLDGKTIKENLKITNSLHATKIELSIEELRERQKKYEDHILKLREKKLQEEMERLNRLKMLENEKKKEKEKEPKKKKKSKPKNTTTIFGEIKESAALDKVKLERDLRLKREQERLDRLRNKKTSTWNFEYTGQPKPTEDLDIWQKLALATDKNQKGSSHYLDTMKNEVANDISPFTTKMRTIPSNATTDEIIAIIKGSMFELSSWLLKVDYLNRQREIILDEDLIDNENTLSETLNTKGTFDTEEYQPDLSARSQTAELPPPSYDDYLSETVEVKDNQFELEETDDNDLKLEMNPLASTNSFNATKSMPSVKKTMIQHLLQATSLQLIQDIHPVRSDKDRMTLIYQEFVNQKNNDARWLGPNEKLTRLKLHGGIETLLKLKLDWTQFDALWTRLDYKRSGDIDLSEFKEFFGDLSEFNEKEGVNTLSLTNNVNSNKLDELTHTLYKLCDVLRNAGFTIVDMFSSFDRNGSGSISTSEFCSLLRTILGPTFNKRLIYSALNVLDIDGDKSISLNEIMIFIYRVWKSQINDLANKLYELNESVDNNLIKKLLNERQQIKLAIKKNFSRQWRDKLEREGSTIPGPFTSLLKRLNIDTSNESNKIENIIEDSNNFTASNNFSNRFSSSSQSATDFNSSPLKPHPPLSSSTTSLNSPSIRNLSKSGHNQILRFKIKVPHNNDNSLKLPIKDLVNENKNIKSTEITNNILNSSYF